MLSIAASTPTTANCIRGKIAAKYAASVKIIGPPTDNALSPQITGCSIDETTAEEFITRLKLRNRGFEHAEYHKHYDITVARPYRNWVIKMSIEEAQPILERAKVVVNMQLKNIFEIVDPMQCRRCHRYGHTSFNCPHPMRCKKCGSTDHIAAECPAETDTCSNCADYNTRVGITQTLNTRHRVTSDTCPIKVTRIDALKEHLLNRTSH